MKGIFIYNNFEISVEVKGVDFCQGDSLYCTLTVKNHGDAREVPPLSLDLAVADLKKVKERQDDASRTLSAASLSPIGSIAPKEQRSVTHTFVLDKNCMVSDKSQSLAILYGIAGDKSGLKLLPITILPHRHIQKIVSTFESPFQFVVKGQKSSGDWLEVKMKPPSAKRLVMVDELVTCFHFDDEALDLKYKFKVKAFDTSEKELNVKKKQSVVEQRLDSKRYLLSPEHLNLEVVEQKIEEALGEVATAL